MKLSVPHIAWLSANKHRNASWLKRMIQEENFHIHHLDANPKNNNADNLILIDAHDHMKLHGLNPKLALKQHKAKKKQKGKVKRPKVRWICLREGVWIALKKGERVANIRLVWEQQPSALENRIHRE